jgi:CelD/BcsL family acetyltransferase involved in cellulose biosynthesis
MADGGGGFGDGRSFTIQAYEDFEALREHRAEWDRLAQEGFSGSQTFAYAEAAWLTRRGNAEKLYVILAHINGRLIGVWPLYVAKLGRVRIARHLGCGGTEEYAEPLIAPDCPREEVAHEIFLFATGVADVLEVYNVPSRSPITGELVAVTLPKHWHPMKSLLASTGVEPSWEAWAAKRSKSFRSGLRYDRKRLGARGIVTFSEISQDGASPASPHRRCSPPARPGRRHRC